MQVPCITRSGSPRYVAAQERPLQPLENRGCFVSFFVCAFTSCRRFRDRLRVRDLLGCEVTKQPCPQSKGAIAFWRKVHVHAQRRERRPRSPRTIAMGGNMHVHDKHLVIYAHLLASVGGVVDYLFLVDMCLPCQSCFSRKICTDCGTFGRQ